MIIIINGPSGSGKTTLGEYYKSLGLKQLVTSTTREKREGEVHGISYYFLTKDEFLQKERIEESIYVGNYYGLTKEEVDFKTKDNSVVFGVLDINGVKALKSIYKDEVKVIYIKISKNKVKKRMKDRGDSVENIIKRIKFRNETKEDENYKYADFIIHNNFDLNYLKKKGLAILNKLNIKMNNKNEK